MARTLKDVMSIRRIPLDEERRRNAALWLFIVKNGLMEKFKEFYRQYSGCNSELLQAYLMEEYRNQLFATDAETNEAGL